MTGNKKVKQLKLEGMIQANELRCGNVIKDTEGVVLTVKQTKIDDDDILVVERPSLLTINYTALPLPLTSKILEKIWGKRKKIKGVTQIRDFGDPEPEGDTEYWDRGKFTIVRWNKGDFTLSTSHGFDNRIVLNSVHQLQNLYFALTGKELTVQVSDTTMLPKD